MRACATKEKFAAREEYRLVEVRLKATFQYLEGRCAHAHNRLDMPCKKSPQKSSIGDPPYKLIAHRVVSCNLPKILPKILVQNFVFLHTKDRPLSSTIMQHDSLLLSCINDFPCKSTVQKYTVTVYEETKLQKLNKIL